MSRFLPLFAPLAVLGLFAATGSAMAASSDPGGVSGFESANTTEVAVNPPRYLQLEITSACTTGGTLFKIVNRGEKWPKHGYLHLYHTDDKSVMTERRIRLAPRQKVSFVVSKKKSNGRPMGMWIEPEWYERDFEYDAKIACR